MRVLAVLVDQVLGTGRKAISNKVSWATSPFPELAYRQHNEAPKKNKRNIEGWYITQIDHRTDTLFVFDLLLHSSTPGYEFSQNRF